MWRRGSHHSPLHSLRNPWVLWGWGHEGWHKSPWAWNQACIFLLPQSAPFLHERIVPWKIRVIETSENKKWLGRKDTRVERKHDALYFIAAGWSHSLLLCLFITLGPLIFQIPMISPILFTKIHNMIEDLQGYVKNEVMDSEDGCTLLS